jgi:PadR family transcriptional regulator, regulatory protein PadR
MPDSTLDNWTAQIRKGWLEVAILAILWQGRRYGLEIVRELEARSDLIVAEGTVYPVLSRLSKEGLLAAEWQESDSGHPRKYYSLTAAGRQRTLLLAQASGQFLSKMMDLVKPLLEEENR